MRVPPLVAGCGEKPPRSPAPSAERPDRREGQHGDEVWVAHAFLVAVGCEPDTQRLTGGGAIAPIDTLALLAESLAFFEASEIAHQLAK